MYNGDEKLVVSIDLGTTNTGVSFAHLQPGATPRVRSVTRWPGQEDAAGDCKLPTLVLYRDGKAVAFGAGALEDADVDGAPASHLAYWFKLHLHPQTMRNAHNLDVPPLPPTVSLKQVYADFLSFLFRHTVEFFQTSSHDGETLWSRLSKSFVLVLATPNGWDAVQQGFLRDAVLRAGVLSEGFAAERLQFVTEAEASVHFALEHTRAAQWLAPHTTFACLDAGGSTVDATVYRCTATAPNLVLEEVTGSECVQAGSVFVNRDAEQFLRIKLENSKYGRDDYVSDMMGVFEKKTKRRFDGSDDPSVMTFGRMQDNDADCNISRGRITLTSDEVKLAFQNSVTDIIASCASIMERSRHRCDTILLVGGYSDSAYLRSTLREKFAADGIQLITADDGNSKAAAEGATIWYTTQLVQARAARAHFAVNIFDPFKTSATHLRLAAERPEAITQDVDGMKIGPLFSTIVPKHEVVRADERKTFSYFTSYATNPSTTELKDYHMHIYAFDGAKVPDWTFVRNSSSLTPGVRKVCTIRADMSGLVGALERRQGHKEQDYWELQHQIMVSFGTTALHVAIQWTENGVLKESPLQIIPDSFV